MTINEVPMGQLPPLGEVPKTMTAMVVRPERYGEPQDAFKIESVEVPALEPDQVLVAVMATGINYNNVFAARGVPLDVIAARQKAGQPWDFHIGGSDASGVVYAVGSEVENVEIGAEVVIHHGTWDRNDKWVLEGRDPILAPSARIWGYDATTNFGSFGQFCVAQAHQIMPKAPQLTWEEAAASSLVGTTAYRMLFGWEPNTVKPGDAVLVWGGSGGLGSQAIQLVKHAGGLPIAVVSSPDRADYCAELGAVGSIDRNEFSHWGIPPHWTDAAGQKEWSAGARAFGKKIWDILGSRQDPAIVFEHPGEDTIPTSIFVTQPGGMVVICAGTTGYSATVDLRYHWTRQKRLQGSHGTNDPQALAYNELIIQGAISPSVGEVVAFTEIGRLHQDMADGKGALGNRVALVGAPEPGLGAK